MRHLNLFEKEEKIKEIRKLLQNNENWWLEKLSRKLNISKSSLSRFLDSLDIINKKQIGRKKFLFINKERSNKEREVLNKAKCMHYAIYLRKKGYSYSEIETKVLNKYKIKLNSGLLSNYLKNISMNIEGEKRFKLKISKDRSRAGKLGILSQRKKGIIGKASRKNLKFAIQARTKKLLKSSKKLTIEKVKIISHCFFDGYVSKSKRYLAVSYCSNIKKQVEAFCELIKKVYGLKAKIKFIENRIYSVRFCSKELVKDLFNYTKSYSTKANTNAKIPTEILKGNKKIKRAFLKAFWDDEGAILVSHRLDKKGYFHPKQKLEAFCTNQEMLADLLKLHKSIGVNASIKRNRIEISGRKNLKAFKKNIGFSDYIIVTNKKSIWYGIPKNLILDYALFYYNHKLKAYIKTFGCCANKADSTKIEGYLIKMGIIIVDHEKQADIIIINSCGVKTPVELNVLKYANNLAKNKKIILVGCLVDILPNIKEKTPLVGAFFGANKTYLIVPAIISCLFPKFKLKSKNHIKPDCKLNLIYKNNLARIKVSQGCLGNCSFCCTKFAQGNLFSYPEKEILKEIRVAIKDDCKEIYLTSQDMGCYGFDRNTNLVELLKKIVSIKRDFWIRIGMMNPNYVTDELIELYKNEKIYKFIHIPVQSGSDKILKSMNRLYTTKDFEKVVKKFRKEIPQITISTDIIIGFPGETEKDFEKSYELIKKIKPDVLNITRYWPRKGTKAAEFPDQIHSRIKKERSRKITKLFNRIVLEKNKKWLGKQTEVLINSKGKYKNQYKGRNIFYRPVVVNSRKNILGKKIRVKIVKISESCLIGENI